MRVIYSNGARIAGGGIGNTSYHAVRGLWRNDQLSRLLCGSYRPTDLPVEKIRSLGKLSRVWRRAAANPFGRRLDHAYRLYYDRWASGQLVPAKIFHGWSGYSLTTILAAKERRMVTVLDRALAHPIYLNQLMQDEYERYGIEYTWSPTADRIVSEIQAADVVFVPSSFVMETFAAQGEDLSKLIVIPFGTDLDRFRPTQARSYEPPFRVLFMGHISVRKGVPYLLEAWRSLGWRDAELWLVGQDHLPSALWERWQDLPGIRRPGYVKNPSRMLSESDVFAFPSLAEGSALVTYEAMAAGLPVVTTANSGSIIQDNLDGVLVPVRDQLALAAALERLRGDEELRSQLGRAARRSVEAYSWTAYGNRVAEVTRQLRSPGQSVYE